VVVDPLPQLVQHGVAALGPGGRRALLDLVQALVEAHPALPFIACSPVSRTLSSPFPCPQRLRPPAGTNMSASCSIAFATPDLGASRTTGVPLFTDCGTTTSLGMSDSALICSVRSTS